MTDPEGKLEQTLIREFLRSRGHDEASVAALGDADRRALLAEASKYAAVRLAAVEARAHFVHDIHGAESKE